MYRLEAVPIELKEAQSFINNNHRHHIAPSRDKFRVGCKIGDKLVGVAMVGRPLARALCDGKTLEVLRLCTIGDKDVCSFLYSRCGRIAKEMGYKKIITYILETENGTSLKASGWKCEAENVGGGVGMFQADIGKRNSISYLFSTTNRSIRSARNRDGQRSCDGTEET